VKEGGGGGLGDVTACRPPAMLVDQGKEIYRNMA